MTHSGLIKFFKQDDIQRPEAPAALGTLPVFRPAVTGLPSGFGSWRVQVIDQQGRGWVNCSGDRTSADGTYRRGFWGCQKSRVKT